ncbi:hypothetical protein LMIY3S_03416 [Labrys miyagiensis]
MVSVRAGSRLGPLLCCAALGLAPLLPWAAQAQEAPAASSAPQAKPAVKPKKPPARKKPPATPAAAVTPQPPPPLVLPDPPLPVQQASQIGMTSCVPLLGQMSKSVLTANYNIQAGWNRQDPANHIFQSVAILNSPANVPPDGLAAIVAAPMPRGCEGVTLQVFPLAGSCALAEKNILASGKKLGTLLKGSILLDAQGHRLFLVPGFSNTCIAVAVDTVFGTP